MQARSGECWSTVFTGLPLSSLSVLCRHPQEIEKEVWEKDANGKRKLRLVQETGYQYEQELEGADFQSRWAALGARCLID